MKGLNIVSINMFSFNKLSKSCLIRHDTLCTKPYDNLMCVNSNFCPLFTSFIILFIGDLLMWYYNSRGFCDIYDSKSSWLCPYWPLKVMLIYSIVNRCRDIIAQDILYFCLIKVSLI